MRLIYKSINQLVLIVRISPTEFKIASPNEHITQEHYKNVTVHISGVNRIAYKDTIMQNPHAHAGC